MITGSSDGFGKALAIDCARRGMNLILVALPGPELHHLGNFIRKNFFVDVQCFETNLEMDSEIHDLHLKIVEKGLAVNTLINNAGIGIHASFAETTEAQFDTLVDIQFKGPFFLTQKTLPVLNDGGAIINISSGLARFSTPGYAAYASMKGAMETLTKYQAKELGTRGIRSNIVAPGAIETDFGGGVVRDNEQLNAGIAANTALGRVGLPDDIGGIIAFLCTEDARWINAQRIEASGGMFL